MDTSPLEQPNHLDGLIHPNTTFNTLNYFNDEQNNVLKLREKTQLCISQHRQNSQDYELKNFFMPTQKINPLALSYQRLKQDFPWIRSLRFDRCWRWQTPVAQSKSNHAKNQAIYQYQLGQFSLLKQSVTMLTTWQIHIACESLAAPYVINLKMLIEHLLAELKHFQTTPCLLECHVHIEKMQTSAVRLNDNNVSLGLNTQLYKAQSKTTHGVSKITKTVCIAVHN